MKFHVSGARRSSSVYSVSVYTQMIWQIDALITDIQVILTVHTLCQIRRLMSSGWKCTKGSSLSSELNVHYFLNVLYFRVGSLRVVGLVVDHFYGIHPAFLWFDLDDDTIRFQKCFKVFLISKTELFVCQKLLDQTWVRSVYTAASSLPLENVVAREKRGTEINNNINAVPDIGWTTVTDSAFTEPKQKVWKFSSASWKPIRNKKCRVDVWLEKSKMDLNKAYKSHERNHSATVCHDDDHYVVRVVVLIDFS